MNFEESYNILLKYARFIVDERKSSLDPSDLLNDAYILLHRQPFKASDFRRAMRGILISEKRRSASLLSIDNIGTPNRIETSRQCIDCKEVLPINAFPEYKKKDTKNCFGNICKKCRYIKWYANRKSRLLEYRKLHPLLKNIKKENTQKEPKYFSQSVLKKCPNCELLLHKREFKLIKAMRGFTLSKKCKKCIDIENLKWSEYLKNKKNLL